MEANVSVLERIPSTTIQARIPGSDSTIDVLVDDDYDAEYFRQYDWILIGRGYVAARAVSTVHVNEATGERVGTSRIPFIYLHHLVQPPLKGLWVSFRNGNPLDCRSANVYYITPSDSAQTRKQAIRRNPSAVSYSKYRGVQRMTASRKGKDMWVSNRLWNVYVQGKFYGSFSDEKLAAQVYDSVAKRIWGDKAILNFPKED